MHRSKGMVSFGTRNGQVTGGGRASVLRTTFDVERGHSHLERRYRRLIDGYGYC